MPTQESAPQQEWLRKEEVMQFAVRTGARVALSIYLLDLERKMAALEVRVRELEAKSVG